jgi:hypothetical protein
MKLTRSQFRQLIKEVLLQESAGGSNPSWNLYKYSAEVWKNLKTVVPGTQIQPEVANAIRDIYIGISGIAQQFALPNTPGGKINSQDIDRSISEITARLSDLKKFSQETPEQIAVLTGDDAFDTANISFTTRAEDIEVDDDEGIKIAAPRED